MTNWAPPTASSDQARPGCRRDCRKPAERLGRRTCSARPDGRASFDLRAAATGRSTSTLQHRDRRAHREHQPCASDRQDGCRVASGPQQDPETFHRARGRVRGGELIWRVRGQLGQDRVVRRSGQRDRAAADGDGRVDHRQRGRDPQRRWPQGHRDRSAAPYPSTSARSRADPVAEHRAERRHERGRHELHEGTSTGARRRRPRCEGVHEHGDPDRVLLRH